MQVHAALSLPLPKETHAAAREHAYIQVSLYVNDVHTLHSTYTILRHVYKHRVLAARWTLP